MAEPAPARAAGDPCPYRGLPCSCPAVCDTDAIRAQREAEALDTPQRSALRVAS